jgi:predicted MFS family arabinose efflux permease
VFHHQPISFLAVIASLLALNAARLYPTTPTPRDRGQLSAGFRYAASIPDIIRPLLMMAMIGTFAFEFEVSFPLLAHDTFHGGADAYGFLLGAFGAGAVAGGLYALGKAKTGVARLSRIAVGYAAAMALLAVVPTLWTAVGACGLVGLATILFLTTGNSTVQLTSDPHYRGRVMALWSMALVGSTPIGAPTVGLVSEAFDPRVAVLLGALACATAAVIGWAPASGRRDLQVADQGGPLDSGPAIPEPAGPDRAHVDRGGRRVLHADHKERR